MASLYVDRRGVTMRLDGDAIAFFENGQRIGTVPIGPLERVYLRGDIQLSSALLGRLGHHGLAVVILSGRRAEPSIMLPRPHNDAMTRSAQLRAAADPQLALGLARRLVEGKIGAQRRMLTSLAQARPALQHDGRAALATLARMGQHARTKPDLAALRGLEGAASAAYFSVFTKAFAPSLQFTSRNRRPPRDPVNALLSLSYTLLHAEAVVAAHGHGFDPFVGFLHGIDYGRESLACDLVEPLRPLMDAFVCRLFAEQTLRARDFGIEKDGACLLKKAGRQRFYAAVDGPLGECRRRLDRMLPALRRMLVQAEPLDGFLPDSDGNDDETLSHQL